MQAKAQLAMISELNSRLEEHISDQEKARIYARLGMLYTARSLDSCYHFSIHALDLAREIKDKYAEGAALNALSFYYMEKGNAYLAYSFINESLAIFERLGNQERVCEVTMNLGVLLSMEGKAEQAFRHFEKAYAKSENLEKDSIRSLVLVNLAISKINKVPYFEIKPLFDEAKEIAKRNQDERTLLSIEMTDVVAKAEMSIEDDEKNHAELDQIIKASERKGYEYLVARGYFEAGLLSLSRNKVDSAQVFFKKAVDLARETGYSGLEVGFMARSYEAMRDLHPRPEIASEYGAKLLEISRQRYVENEKEGIGMMELVIKEKEIEAQQAKYQLRRTWMWGGFLMALLTTLIAVFMYRQYRSKRRFVSELSQSNKDLHSTNQRLEQNDDFHKKLIAILSHDLRQPFAAIQMLSDEMLQDFDVADLKLLSQEMRHSATVSLQVMDGLLHWMKLQTMDGGGDRPDSIALYGNIMGAWQFNEYESRKKDIEIDLQIDDFLWVTGQKEMLLFANRNILHNAIKYTSAGGKVTVTAEIIPMDSADGEESLLVRISDTGPGISEEVLDSLFKKAVSSANGQRKNNGAGIALIICHEMIEKMGGTMWAANNTDGPGASFYYRLPRTQPVAESVASAGFIFPANTSLSSLL